MKKWLLSLVAFVCVMTVNAQNPYDKYYINLPCAVEKVQPVVFPDYTVKLTDFGAVGDGVTDCTEAFRYALKICNNKGYAIRFNANRTYVVKDSINHYDGTDNIVKNISLIGESYIKGGNYPASGNNAGCIYISPLFSPVVFALFPKTISIGFSTLSKLSLFTFHNLYAYFGIHT